MVVVSFYRGNLWRHIKFLHLRQNMHLGHCEADNQHAQWLLEIGVRSTMNNNKMINSERRTGTSLGAEKELD